MTQKVTYRVETRSKEEYCYSYTNHVASVIGLASTSEKRFFAKLLLCADNDGNVVLSSKKRKELCEEEGISRQSFTNMIAKLKVLQVLKGEKGDYQLCLGFIKYGKDVEIKITIK